MNKKLAALTFAAVCALGLAAGCGDGEKQPITLSFDSQVAYFTSQTELYPIEGEVPAEGDAVESATVRISSDAAVRMVLKVIYDEGQQDIPGLVVSVNGGTASDFTDGMALYTSPKAETSAEIGLQIWLEKDSPITNAGRTLGFSLELSALEERGEVR